MTKSKLYQWTIPALLLIVLVGLIIFEQSLEQSKDANKALGAQFSSGRNPLSSATTTIILVADYDYITTSTSTNLFGTIDTAGVDQVNLNLHSVASSTTANIAWKVFYSDNGSDWFQKSLNSTSGRTITHSTDSNTWTPGATATTTANVLIADINSKWMRLDFATWEGTSTTSGAALWAEAIVKRQF